ncbi:flagellar basal body L-ring protein FlgH [Thioalkalicoccus limnaeus]|uniref:Flagellar L-ring protein n=1 Tax=Thioalkalicoccus limnaeus TaxID=120681 RepID=A0ABV4BF38_9GAMM
MTPLSWIGGGLGAAGLLLIGGCASVTKPPPVPGDNPAYVAARPVPPPPEAVPPVVMPSPTQFTGSLYRAGYGMMLFENAVARNIGDILTITLMEKTAAKKNAMTGLAKDSTGSLEAAIRAAGMNVDPRSLDLDVTVDRAFDGVGKSEQSNSLQGNISVVVSEVLPNGNLLVGGEKWLTLNQGEEFIRITGIVRPQDIRPDNTVSSLLVADARISYGGTGTLADTNRPGWLTRFFLNPIFPL